MRYAFLLGVLIVLAACTASVDTELPQGEEPAQGERFVVCSETVTGFSAEEYADNIGATCVTSCPDGFDNYTTQIGVTECIQHYGAEEIAAWDACERTTESCACVRAYETTTGTEIADAAYRCVPDQYAERMLFRGGQDRLDESGDQGVTIA